MPRPTTRPSWQGTRRAPTPAQRIAGFQDKQTPPAEWLNWIFGSPSDWLDYVDDWIQNTGIPEADALERALEMQSFAHPRDVASATVTMQINSVAAATDVNGVLLHAVAVGNSGVIMRYDAVRTETTHPTAAASFTGTWNDVIWAGGQYVAIGASGTVQTSPDGITWTSRTGVTSTITLTSIAYGGGKYVIAGGDGGGTGNGASYWSTDGITWTSATVGNTLVGRVVWGGGSVNRFVLFTGSNIRYSPATTISWVSTGVTMGATQVFDGCWSPKLGFLGLSRGSTNTLLMYSSQDGATGWTNVSTPAGFVTSSSVLSVLPLANQIALLFAPNATTYASSLIVLPSVPVQASPIISPGIVPAIYPGVAKRMRIAQSTWLAGFNRSSTAARMVCGCPIETLRGMVA